MVKCPFCQSENIEQLNSMDYVSKNYRKIEKNMTTTSSPNYPISRYLCVNCGMTFNIMQEKVLQKYKEDKPYFV